MLSCKLTRIRDAAITFQAHREDRMLRLADAQRVIAAAQKQAAEIGQPMNIAVADAGGNLVAHVRMDDAWIGSIDISIKKAYTSRAFDIATKDLASIRNPAGSSSASMRPTMDAS